MARLYKELEDMSSKKNIRLLEERCPRLAQVVRFYKSYEAFELLEEARNLLEMPENKAFITIIGLLKVYAHIKTGMYSDSAKEFVSDLCIAKVNFNDKDIAAELASLFYACISKISQLKEMVEWVDFMRVIQKENAERLFRNLSIALASKEVEYAQDMESILRIFDSWEKIGGNNDGVLEIICRKALIIIGGFEDISEIANELADLQLRIKSSNYKGVYAERLLSIADLIIGENMQFVKSMPMFQDGNKIIWKNLSRLEAKSLENEFEYIKNKANDCLLQIINYSTISNNFSYNFIVETEPFHRSLYDEIMLRWKKVWYLTPIEYLQIQSNLSKISLLLQELDLSQILKIKHFLILPDSSIKLFRIDFTRSEPDSEQLTNDLLLLNPWTSQENH
jgi:hypothetical protein